MLRRGRVAGRAAACEGCAARLLVVQMRTSLVLVFAFHRLGRAPGVGNLMVGFALFAVALIPLYSLWILTRS